MNRFSTALGVAVVLGGVALPVGAADAAADTTTYTVVVTCTVPRRQAERQLAANHCMNYLPDGTQTYNATVTDSNGRAVQGVRVYWTDDSAAARFRVKRNPCTTGSNGMCSDELVVRKPRADMQVQVTATVGDSQAVGYLSFR